MTDLEVGFSALGAIEEEGSPLERVGLLADSCSAGLLAGVITRACFAADISRRRLGVSLTF